ncbi:MAG: FAD-dependent oxidoreductase [Kiritimatiellaeota bacterium]|nr:FAD-dependent oxidoreductase [Kiritimatiellota bacterium]
MSSVLVRENLYWVGVQDHDLRVFDVIMRTEYGTSYNSYLLKTDDGCVLFETAKAAKFDVFMSNLREVCDPSDIKYIVIDHTEPDHTGSLAHLLDTAPNATVLASPIALRFLGDICNREIRGIGVGDDDVVTIGEYNLRFLSVPFLHWPDSIYTYVEKLKTLVTCDSFGCHYADDKVCDDLMEGEFTDAYKYYFDMIMSPFKPYVRDALNKIATLNIETICPGHGPVLRNDLERYIGMYDEWSREPKPEKRSKPKVTMAYVSAYGYTEELARKIAEGINGNLDVDLKPYDMVVSDESRVLSDLMDSDAILLGSPTVNGDSLPPVTDLLMKMNGVLHGGKVAGAFGSYGWSGEAADMLTARLNVLRMKTLEPPLKAVFKPSAKELAAAYDYGRRFAAILAEEWVPDGLSETGKQLWKCTVCGEVFEGALPPSTCPVCGAGAEAFAECFEEKINFSSNKKFKTVVIGGGPAAVYAADALRKRNPDAEIDIYSSDDKMPYYRPALTKQLAEDLTAEDIPLFPKSHYEENSIFLHLGSSISKILPAENVVLDESGNTIPYDKLIIATGARCFVPPIQGADLPEVVALRDFSSFKKLKSIVENGARKIVVLGGGLLGLEAANSLLKLGVDTRVLEMAPGLLPRQLDDAAAAILSKTLESSNVKVATGVFIEEIDGERSVTGVLTDKLGLIECDAVVISAGTRANVDLALAAGLDVDRGIVVNERMRTSHTDIYAAGDCVSFNGALTGLWEPAMEQGRVAGAHIAGDNVSYAPPVIGAALNAFGITLFSVGDLGRDKDNCSRIVARDDMKPSYKNLCFADGVLTGGILLGDVSKTNQLLYGVKKSMNYETARDNKLL